MKKLLTYFFAAALLISAFSCGSDDKVDCDGNYGKINAQLEAYDEAAINSDCEQMESISAKIASLVRKSKSCSFVKEEIEAEGYADVEELIDDFMSDVEADMANAGC